MAQTKSEPQLGPRGGLPPKTPWKERSRRAPPYICWAKRVDRQPVLRANVRLNDGGKIRDYLSTADFETAKQRLRPHVAKAIADGRLWPDSKAARLYGPDDAVTAFRSRKAPSCLCWIIGIDLPNDGGLGRDHKPVLQTNIKLADGSTLRRCLNTADPVLAIKRLRPLIAEAIAHGRLRPDTLAAHLYGPGAAATLRSERPPLGDAELEAEISRLSALPLPQFEAQREDAAIRLGLSLRILDRLVTPGRGSPSASVTVDPPELAAGDGQEAQIGQEADAASAPSQNGYDLFCDEPTTPAIDAAIDALVANHSPEDLARLLAKLSPDALCEVEAYLKRKKS
jgi:hypothetical protein